MSLKLQTSKNGFRSKKEQDKKIAGYEIQNLVSYGGGEGAKLLFD